MAGTIPGGETERIRSGSEVAEHPDSAASRISRCLRDLGVSHSFPEGSELLRQGLPVRQICLIEEGLVKLSCNNYEGMEAIVGLRCQGWPLGITSLLSHSPSPFSAATLTRSRIRSVPLHHFRRIMDSDPQLLLAISELGSQEIVSYVEQFANLALSPARQRLVWILARLVMLMEKTGRSPAGEFRIPLRQLELARMIVVTPAYLSQMLGELERECLCARRRGWILIPDPDRLKRLSTM